MKVLLDTAPVYALLDAGDQAHQRALTIFGQAAEEALTLVCPLSTALELHNLLGIRKLNDPRAASRALQGVLNAYSLVTPTPVEVEAAKRTLAYDKTRLTLADALIASMASARNARLLSFDRQRFEQLGVELYP